MVDKHFFQPLLPDFHSHLTIPIAFFSKYIEGRNEQKTTAKLRSDASKITWEVKIEDGQKLTDGWREFALAHDLRIGDILIFRQERDMSFHVTLFGPSCCEILYESCLDDENNLAKIPKKKNPRKETVSSSLDPSCFVANVSPSNLRDDSLDNGRRIRLTGGWKEFFKANCVEIGESSLLKLIWEGDKSCVLKFCSKAKQETN